MKNLSIAFIFCLLLSFSSFADGSNPNFQIDGNLSENELRNTHEQDLGGGGKVFYKTIGSQLYIGVRGVKAGISHICVTDGKDIYVLHASGALGRAVFQNKDGKWHLTEKFKWEMRDKSMTEEAKLARNNYYNKNGWLANTFGMGQETEMEYIISDKFKESGKFRFAMVYIDLPEKNKEASKNIHYFPNDITDDSKLYKLTAGDPPNILRFAPNSWAVSTKVTKSSKKENSLKQQIESQNAKFAELTSKKDFNAAAKIYTEGGQLLQPNGKTITGRKGVADYWKATFATGIKEIKTIVSEIEGTGKMLYEIGRYEVYLPNNQMVDDGKYIVIWKKVDSKWLRHRDIWNSNRKSQ